MRGKPVNLCADERLVGITPACAGKTLCPPRAQHSRGDHPRVCGENQDRLRLLVSQPGSPPRVRGKLKRISRELELTGITPACAGKTEPGQNCKILHRDHPRVCGENSRTEHGYKLRHGSPPRVRGKLYQIFAKFPLARITPACAGKTRHEPTENQRQKDHPRVCGENPRCRKLARRKRGSPPRVRGKLSRKESMKETVRITPACAGKTSPVGGFSASE